ISRTTMRVATTPPKNPATKISTSTPMTLTVFMSLERCPNVLVFRHEGFGKLRGAFAQARRVRSKNHFTDDANGDHRGGHHGDTREPHAEHVGNREVAPRGIALDLLHHQERETF